MFLCTFMNCACQPHKEKDSSSSVMCDRSQVLYDLFMAQPGMKSLDLCQTKLLSCYNQKDQLGSCARNDLTCLTNLKNIITIGRVGEWHPSKYRTM